MIRKGTPPPNMAFRTCGAKKRRWELAAGLQTNIALFFSAPPTPCPSIPHPPPPIPPIRPHILKTDMGFRVPGHSCFSKNTERSDDTLAWHGVVLPAQTLRKSVGPLPRPCEGPAKAYLGTSRFFRTNMQKEFPGMVFQSRGPIGATSTAEPESPLCF